MIGMDITVQAGFLPQDGPEACLAFYRDVLGFEVRSDVGRGTMRWIMVGPANQPDTRPSCWRRRPPTSASLTTSAVPSRR